MPRLRLPALQRKPAPLAAKNTVTYQIGMDALAASYSRKHAAKRVAEQPFKLPEFPPVCLPPKGTGLAMDETPLSSVTSWAAAQAISSAWSEGLQFLGYTYLSELAQRAEYRVPSEIIAEEMTRKWIRFQGKGDADKTDKISELTDYLDDLKLKATFHQAALIDGLMGRGHIYIDTGQTKDGDELQTSIGNGRDDVSRSKVGKGKLRGFKVIEPIFAYPLSYNSSDPLADDWYRPEQWFAMSRSIHRSRFLTLVGRPVPDILKPAYAFGGLSLSQLGKPYVDNWLRTRQSVSDLVHSFTVFKLGTDMSTLLMDQGDQLFRRMELFNNLRDNNNLFLHDKETEEFDNTSAPLGTLDALLNKSQEQMASVWRIPLVKLLGIQPGGLNASSEGEIVTFYDTINAQQERLFRPPLTTCIDFAQMSLWGDVDPDIVFVFEPLRALSRKEEAEVRKTDAETGQILVSGGTISPEEERKRITSDPDTMYQGLDPNDVPDLQEEEEAGLAIKGAGGAEKAILEGPGGEGDKPKPESDKPKNENDKGAAKDGIVPFDGAGDEFKESDHPRAENGEFGSGGGSSSEAGKTTGESEGSVESKPAPRKMSVKASERIKTAASWLKTTAVEKVLTGDNIKSAAAIGIKSALYHGLQFDDAMMGVLEDYLHTQVKNVAETASVTHGVMRDTMLSVVNALINVRKGKTVAKDSDDGDPILALLERMKGALEGMEIAEEEKPAKDTVLSKISAALKSDKIATDPPVSESQRRAMFAAAEGKSTLGIPKEVGEEFIGKAGDE